MATPPVGSHLTTRGLAKLYGWAALSSSGTKLSRERPRSTDPSQAQDDHDAEKREYLFADKSLQMSALLDGAARLEIELNDAQLARLDQLGAALLDGNQ